MYHYVRPIASSRYPGIRGLEIEQFRGQLDYIARHYNPIATEDLISSLQGGAALPPRPILLQFDDGYTDHIDFVAPELEQRGWRGTFFPIASTALDRTIMNANRVQFVLAAVADVESLIDEMEANVLDLAAGRDLPTLSEYRKRHFHATRIDTASVIYIKRMLQVALPEDLRISVASRMFARHVSSDEQGFAASLYMSVTQLRRMVDAGHTVGCHTDRHPWMSSLSADAQRQEVLAGLRVLDAIGLPRDGFTFCYPYGDFNSDSLAVLTELGCAAAFTAEVALAELSPATRLKLPRLDTIDLPMEAGAPVNRWTELAREARAYEGNIQ
jgi:peptidoglycan/xylan/chitin deacetylase (PgdA/CDA1 family)